MLPSKSPSKFYDDPTVINLLKAMSNSVSIISGHPLFRVRGGRDTTSFQHDRGCTDKAVYDYSTFMPAACRYDVSNMYRYNGHSLHTYIENVSSVMIQFKLLSWRCHCGTGKCFGEVATTLNYIHQSRAATPFRWRRRSGRSICRWRRYQKRTGAVAPMTCRPPA